MLSTGRLIHSYVVPQFNRVKRYSDLESSTSIAIRHMKPHLLLNIPVFRLGWNATQQLFLSSRKSAPTGIGIITFRSNFDSSNQRIPVHTFRGMSSCNEDEATRLPAAPSSATSNLQARKNEEDLEGLENEFRNAVQVTSNEKLSGEKDDNNDKIPSISAAISAGKDDKIDLNDTQTEAAVHDIPTSKSLRRIASLINDAKNILILSGAGVSVAAGIPDFRTPGTGLYDNLQKYNLPYAEAVFDVQYYAKNPKPFVQLAAELWPDHHVPTITHSFIALLAEKERLLRNYTQNIDGLESMAGVPENMLVECHGHFRTASCIRCKKGASIAMVKESIVSKMEVPMCTYCETSSRSRNHRGTSPAYIKPDIVFFGENLPMRFHKMLPNDIKQADLCIVMGTSLQVPPSAHIPDMVKCPRILLNRELVGNLNIDDTDENSNDMFECGNCDDAIISIAQILDWDNELRMKHDEMTKQLKGKA